MRHILVLLILVAATPATAQRVALDTPADTTQWHEAFAGPGAAIYIDTQTADRTGDTVVAWAWMAYAEADGFMDLPPFDRMLTYERYDCRAQTSALLQISLFRAGKQIRHHAYDSPEEEEWVPGTDRHMIGEYVCRLIR